MMPGMCTSPSPHLRHSKSHRRINPLTASDAALERLNANCAPATFGLDDQDVLDESYRKAGKLDATDFGIKLDIAECGLLDRLRTRLLEGASAASPIRHELYNLNVYGLSQTRLS